MAVLSDFAGDVHRAIRSLARQPGFVLIVALTLGVGVGSGGAVFGMVNQLLLRPLPGVVDPGGAAYLVFGQGGDRNWSPGVSGPVAEELIRSATLFDGIATYDFMGVDVSLSGARPMEVTAYTIYGDYFELLGVRPAIGRLITASETGPYSDASVAVISERLWDRLFGRSQDVVGKSFFADGHRLMVIGVAGDGFHGTDRFAMVDVWVPRSAYVPITGFPSDRFWSDRSTLNQDFVARLRPGVALAAGEAELDRILARLTESDPAHAAELEGFHATLYPGLHIRPELRRMIYPALRLLAAAVLVVLLITCANVANLLLVRGVQRRGEVAVRRALGASAGRVGRQGALESLLLGTAGTLAGLVMAWSIARLFEGESLQYTTSFDGFAFDRRVLIFAAGSVLVTTLLSGALPVLLAGRFDLTGALHDASTRVTQRFTKLRHTMSVLQIALSLTLLIGGLLLARTLRNLYAVDTGLAIDGVSALTLSFGRDTPREGPVLDALHRELVAAVADVPGVRTVALHSSYGPYFGRPWGDIMVPDAADPDAEPQRTAMYWVSPEWFELFDVDVVAGGTFRAADWGAMPVRLVLTAPLADRLFGGVQVIGRRVRVGLGQLDEAVIVGVVGELRLSQLQTPPDEAFFMAKSQRNLNNAVTILARVADGAVGTSAAIRRAVEDVVPGLPVPQAEPLSARIDSQLAEQRLFARLLALLSAMAVLVAAVGLYGVIAFAVAGRKRELAIRQALGADGRRIARLVARSAAGIVAVGIALGLLGAFALSRVIESRLFGVNAVDAGSYAAAVTLLACIAALACWTPAMSAVRVDPATALRQE